MKPEIIPPMAEIERFFRAILVIVVLCYLAIVLLGCCHAPPIVPPPTSLACSLKKPPPPWYKVEVVIDETCPAQYICLTKTGGQALFLNERDIPPWTNEAWSRCGTR